MEYTAPNLIPVPFAKNGEKNTIPQTVSDQSSNQASYSAGFPPVTMVPRASGGKPPQGRDMNGILYELSSNIQYLNAGGQARFNQDFCAAIGGYPKGAVLQSNDGTKSWVSSIDNNTDDPNVNVQNWEVYGGGEGINVATSRVIVKNYSGVAFKKTSETGISIKAGTTFLINNKEFQIVVDTPVANPETYIAGEDYCVWLLPNGTAQIGADPYTSPASAPIDGAIKIGGFHYGLVAPGTTLETGSFNTATSSPLVSMVWTQEMVDAIAGINAHSLWDLNWRPNCPIDEVRGMTCFEGLFWYDIYLCSSNHIANGTSRYNTDVASGTVLPKMALTFGGDGETNYTRLSWFEAIEIVASHGKRLLQYSEFCKCAFGVTENQSVGGAETTIPLTTRVPGYTSRTGGEQMTGNQWVWGALAIGIGGSAWGGEIPRGNQYGTAYAGLWGGHRRDTAYSGSRCAAWSDVATSSYWGGGLRGACDHLNLL